MRVAAAFAALLSVVAAVVPSTSRAPAPEGEQVEWITHESNSLQKRIEGGVCSIYPYSVSKIDVGPYF